MTISTEPIGSTPRPLRLAARIRALRIIRQHLKPARRILIGLVRPINPQVETAEEIRDRILEEAEPDGILVTDYDARVTGFNQQFAVCAGSR